MSSLRSSLRRFVRRFDRSFVRRFVASFVRSSLRRFVRPSLCSFVASSVRRFVRPSLRSFVRCGGLVLFVSLIRSGCANGPTSVSWLVAHLLVSRLRCVCVPVWLPVCLQSQAGSRAVLSQYYSRSVVVASASIMKRLCPATRPASIIIWRCRVVPWGIDVAIATDVTCTARNFWWWS